MKKHKILIQYRGGIKAAPKYRPIFFKLHKLKLPELQMIKPAYSIRAADIDDAVMATATQIMIDKMMKEIDGSIRSALIYGIGFTSFNTKPPMPLEPLPEPKPNRFKALGFSPILQVKNIPIHAVIAQA